MQNQKDIVIIVIVSTLLIFLLAAFIVTILYLYQKKQIVFLKNVEDIKLDYERNLFKTKMEIQEQTFQNISREIHDNICLSLSLAKLNLNILDISQENKIYEKIKSSVELLSTALDDLNNISKSLNSDLVQTYGLIKILEIEIQQINKIGICKIEFEILGEPVFLDSFKELILYRIAQEGFNNILKHSKATIASVILEYLNDDLILTLKDNGIGFDRISGFNKNGPRTSCGLINIQQRSKLIGGDCLINSNENGTSLIINVPIKTNHD
jgi:signal transduction histidine kinase